MKAIKVFGDSFMFGSDLFDCNDKMGKFSTQTWPALIANKLNTDYKCYAWPGVGNNFISQQVIKHADPNSLNVIVWTWIDRWEFFDITTNKWTTVRPTGTEDHPIAEIYYKHLQSELQDKWQSLNYIYSTLCYLKQHNIPYVFHIMDELLLDPAHHCPEYISRLQNDIRDELLRFPYECTFLTWSQLNDFPISTNLHPLEEAHISASALWLEKYKSLL